MKPARPLVSILIPCFNAATYVAVAVESALAQTWSEKEIIVVDDGSTDDSLRILRGFSNSSFRVIAQQNRGAAAARNTAYSASRGEYIKFLDADDVLHPEIIERQIQRLDPKRADVASAEWGRFYDDDLATCELSRGRVWKDMDARDWLVEAWMEARPMMQPAIWLIPRTTLEKVGGWNEELSLIDDFEFFARVLCQSEEVRFAGNAPVYYRSGLRGSLSNQSSRRAVESAYHSLLFGTDHLLSTRSDALARLASANMLQDFIYTYYPKHPDLRRRVALRIEELGGSNLVASGPPRFEVLRRAVGWKLARRVQRLVRH